MTDAASAPSAPPSPRWRVPLPDLSGRRALVTGASDGVGVEIARGLALAGAHVIMPVRSKAKGQRTVDAIRSTHPDASLSLRSLDLSSLASVDALCRQLRAEGEPIDIVVLNAGIVLLQDPVRHVTQDGFEQHLQVNALADAALVAGILPLLRARGGRVVLQCSLAARGGRIRWDDPQFARAGYRPLRAYSASKVFLGLFGAELSRRSDAGRWGVEVVLCHPGVSITNIAPAEMRERRSVSTRLSTALIDSGIAGQSPAEAALPALLAATSPDAADGGFVVPSGPFELRGAPHLRRPYRTFAGRAEAARVWNMVAELTGARFPDPVTPVDETGQANPNTGGSTIATSTAQTA